MPFLSRTPARQVLQVLLGYTQDELRQGLPLPPVKTNEAFAWRDDSNLRQPSLLTRGERAKAIRLFDSFFTNDGFPQKSIQVRGFRISSSQAVKHIMLDEFTHQFAPSRSKITLTIAWGTPSNFMPWWEVENDISAPYNTPVEGVLLGVPSPQIHTLGTDAGTGSVVNYTSAKGTQLWGLSTRTTSLRDWIQRKIVLQQLTSCSYHKWTSFTFNYTFTFQGPHLRNPPFVYVPLPLPVKPFTFEVRTTPKRPLWMDDETKDRAVRAIDRYFSDGYPPRQRTAWANGWDKLIFSRDYLRGCRMSINLYPESNTESNLTNLLMINTEIRSWVPAWNVMWWPLQDNIVTPYDTPVTERTVTDPGGTTYEHQSLRDFIHSRIGVRGSPSGDLVHTWSTNQPHGAGIVFQYLIYQADHAYMQQYSARIITPEDYE